MCDVLIHYAWASVVAGEGSSSPNGLHNVWILKLTLPVLFLLSGLAAWAVFKRNLAKISRTTWDKQLLWAFPTVVFVGWRIIHYAAYWVIYLTNSEVNPRRITREPFFDYALTISLLGVIVLIVLLTVLNRRKET